MKLKVKSYKELIELDLKGYCYYVSSWGMSMTSANSYNPEMWIVLEDKGEECVVARFDSQRWTEKRPKKYIAGCIADFPAISSETYENLIY